MSIYDRDIQNDISIFFGLIFCPRAIFVFISSNSKDKMSVEDRENDIKICNFIIYSYFMREDSTMRKITRSKNPEKRLHMKSKWNASGSTLAMNRRAIDKETVVYAMMSALIVSLILSSILPMVCNAAGDFNSLTTSLSTIASDFYTSFVAKAIKWGAGLALAIAFALRIGAPGSELERRLHGWPMRIIFALFGVAVAPSVIEILSKQLSAAGFFSFTFS